MVVGLTAGACATGAAAPSGPGRASPLLEAARQGAMREVEDILIASFANISALITHLVKKMPDLVTLVAVGKEGVELAAEDELCADHIHTGLLGCQCEYQDIKTEILESPTSQRLRDRGQEDDLEFCLRKDIFDLIPRVRWENGLAIVEPL